MEVALLLEILLPTACALEAFVLVPYAPGKPRHTRVHPGSLDVHQVPSWTIRLELRWEDHGGDLPVQSFDDLWPHKQRRRALLGTADQQHAPIIRHPAVVIPGREDTHQPAIVHHLVALAGALELVGPHDQSQPFSFAEPLCDVSAKDLHDRRMLGPVAPVDPEGHVGHLAVAVIVRQRVRPQDVVHRAVQRTHQVVRGQWALDRAQLVERPLAFAETPMQHEDVALDAGSEWEPMKNPVK
mmetsp:Transcript_98823/g.247749  ORF Transcript_98823/g.247749 Transcript_98823/m.247749 type:complete len:241 (+) Transcript_98823:429-1151(+)